MTTQCSTCGAPLHGGRCSSDWCPSTQPRRDAVVLGEGIGILLRVFLNIGCFALFATFTVGVGWGILRLLGVL